MKNRNEQAVENANKVIKEYTGNQYWSLLYKDVLLAIAYGKLNAFLLMNDNGTSSTTFIEDYTKELQYAIDKKDEDTDKNKKEIRS